MKTFVRHAITPLIVAVACQTGFVLAEDYFPVSSDGNAASAADDQEATPVAPLPCSVEDMQCAEQRQPDPGCKCCCCARQPCRVWTIDYRVRPMFDSHTSYEFGTPPGFAAGTYAPLSKLDFDLDSTWHGLQIGLEKPNWRVHFEWLTPIQRDINGNMEDFDWIPAGNLISHTLSSERWNDGQMLDLGGEFKFTSSLFNLPIEIWPAGGFRFQRFDITATDIFQVVPPLGPVPALAGVDVITFNQQYYQCYFGGQLRTRLWFAERLIDVRFQGDGGPAWGYNVDHHLLRDDFIPGVFDRFTMETTSGGMWHIGLTVEAPITRRLSLGLQADHMEIRTTGEHRYQQASGGIDRRWTNGVKVKSDQTSLTAFVRARF